MSLFGHRSRAVSSTVGAVLLIAVAIALATATLLGLYSMAGGLDDPAPMAATEFEFEADEGGLSVTHVSGDPIETENLVLHGPGVPEFDDETLEPGESFTIHVTEPGGEFTLVYEETGVMDSVIAQADNPVTDDLGGLPSNITLAYEDLEPERSDYDYNDWVVRTETQIRGFEVEDQKFAMRVELDLTPQARFAGFDHDQYLIPDDLGSGTYELTTYDEGGSEVPDESHSGSFEADDRISLLNSADALDSGGSCDPDRTVSIVLDLDRPTQLPPDPINETAQHGSRLPFNPLMEPSGNDLEIGKGDPQLLTVQTDWAWPDTGQHIATAYEEVGPENPDPEGDQPVFESRTWFEEPVDEDELNSCE